MGIGKNIKTLRKQKKMTQQELADLIGISRSYLGDIENERKNISTRTLEDLAKKFNLSSAELLTNDTELLIAGNNIYNKLLEKYPVDSFEYSALSYFKDSYLHDEIVLKAIKKILDVPMFIDIFKNNEDIIDKLDSHEHIIKFYFQQTINKHYLELIKTNENLIRSTIDGVDNLVPNENVYRYSEYAKEDFNNKTIIIEILENNLNESLIQDIQGILNETNDKLNKLVEKYPSKDSEKVITATSIDHQTREVKIIKENILNENRFKNREDLDKFLEAFRLDCMNQIKEGEI